MSDRLAFIEAICREPGEDTHRLVYADWLEETTGRHAVASFIRDQIAGAVRCVPLSHLLPLEPFLGCQPHQCEIHAGAGWCEVTPPGDTQVVFRRGFISEVRCTADDWLRHADDLFWHPNQNRPCPETAHPIGGVVLTTPAGVSNGGFFLTDRWPEVLFIRAPTVRHQLARVRVVEGPVGDAGEPTRVAFGRLTGEVPPDGG